MSTSIPIQQALSPQLTQSQAKNQSLAAADRTARTATWPVPLLVLLWLVVFGASLFSPPLLDDADATHAQAAQAMLRTGDWITLHVNGVRYLEKAPLPYWLCAFSLRLFGQNTFAVHLPVALAVLGLSLLAYAWSCRSFGAKAALYVGLFMLTSIGPFLFTRIFIPEALLSLLLACGLYALERTFAAGPVRSRWPMLFWLAMALAVLTKGLIAIIFLGGTALLYMTATRNWRAWDRLRPLAGVLLFLALAAPWHVLAGLRNTGGANGHGFFWFYFVNEHFLRFLGRREPRDYNKLPALLYWALHLAWLFPWSFFAPVAGVLLWRKRQAVFATTSAAQRTFVLLLSFSALVVVFFSFSTNQEYYTFPAYMPLLMLLAAALARAHDMTTRNGDPVLRRAMSVSFCCLLVTQTLLAAALAYGLLRSRVIPASTDIGSLLSRRGVGQYTLSMSHFFDLTGASFAALRLPASLALLALLLGPWLAWALHRRRHAQSGVLVLAGSWALLLVAAHLALARFAPVLSSHRFADEITKLEKSGKISLDTEVLLDGDQALGSSIPFYLGHPVYLVDGRSSSMLFGSTFPDAPPIFLTSADLLRQWGRGARKVLFVPAEERDAADPLFSDKSIVLMESSGKELLTDRPLNATLPALSGAGDSAR